MVLVSVKVIVSIQIIFNYFVIPIIKAFLRYHYIESMRIFKLENTESQIVWLMTVMY
jgi:hypothetical protein